MAIRIGIAGLGTVGQGVIKAVQSNGQIISQRCGGITVTAVSARDKNKKRGIALGGVKWVDNPLELAADPAVDVVVELIGGASGVAKELALAAIKNGKHFVTANKAMIASSGKELAAAAEEKGVALCFEAAVAGGIPVIKGIKEGLAANEIRSVKGILNGTCNYILTQMEESGRAFAEVLAEAQAKGYAEADPGFDVDGTDTAQKLAILAAIAFGAEPDFESIYTEGIRGITAEDIEYACGLGYRIKLIGAAAKTSKGIEQKVYPAMIPVGDILAAVNDVYNAVTVESLPAGRTFFNGRGAGEGPTASAVVADIIDVACNRAGKPFGVAAASLAKPVAAPMDEIKSSYYLRLAVLDKPGVMADIAGIFRDEKISMRSLLQQGRKPESAVQVVITTHETAEKSMKSALARIGALPTVTEPPHMIRIEQ